MGKASLLQKGNNFVDHDEVSMKKVRWQAYEKA